MSVKPQPHVTRLPAPYDYIEVRISPVWNPAGDPVDHRVTVFNTTTGTGNSADIDFVLMESLAVASSIRHYKRKLDNRARMAQRKARK